MKPVNLEAQLIKPFLKQQLLLQLKLFEKKRFPIRNRYALHEADRRFQINNLTKAEIFPAAFKKGILPLVSDRKWKSISEYIKRRGSIRNAEELRAIKGIGKDTVDIIAPLITFATDK